MGMETVKFGMYILDEHGCPHCTFSATTRLCSLRLLCFILYFLRLIALDIVL
jgi:hypothetical protein